MSDRGTADTVTMPDMVTKDKPDTEIKDTPYKDTLRHLWKH